MMGFISKIKQLFNKNIECGNKLDDRIVYLHPKRYIYLNKNILVAENSAAVIIYKRKVTDVIFAGKHNFNQGTIPETYARAKVAYKKSKNYRVKRLRADIYYVKTSELIDFTFCSDEPFYLKSKQLGRVKGYLEGCCNIKIIDPQAIIRALIFETGSIKDKSEFRDIGLWVGNKIKRIIEKNKTTVDELLINTKNIDGMLNENMEFALDDIGIFANNIKLKAVNFPKKYQGKINEYIMQNKKHISMNGYSAPSQEESNMTKVEKFVGVDEKSNNSVGEMSTMQNLNNPLKITKFIKCSICGTENMISSHICKNCGNKLQ